ncbi:sensor histidine kinase [Candidatus Laterigemmans baculatus]|uniref:sensor histidine kinase n=1 Tax=Candidatus Laterigemmans baculatus TaxID=2770505 RepID=UPI0013D95302|nr:ATP-binding protein [Candidatus Laterigemmans baculatus]
MNSPSSESDPDDLQAERFAADLHDGLIQWVVAAKMHAEAIRAHHKAGREINDDSLAALIETLQRAIAEGRQLIRRLHIPEIAGGYWHAVLKGDLEQMQHIASPTIAPPAKLKIELAAASEPLPQAVATTAYRLIREAVWNAQRHAGADTIRVTADVVDSWLRLDIADDGRGFEPTQVPQARWGVRGMIRRAERAGGTASLETAAGQGTRLRFELPLA